jgi:O-antigen ligase
LLEPTGARLTAPAAALDSWRFRTALVLGGISLVCLLVLPGVAGPASAYVAIVGVLLGAVVLLRDTPAVAAGLAEPASRMFLAAFALLAIAAFFTTRNAGDLLALADFAVLIGIVPAFAVFLFLASPRNAAVVAWLALAGSAVSVLMGAYEGFVLGAERASGNSSPIFFSDLGLYLGFLSLIGFFAPHTRWRYVFALGPILGAIAAQMGGTRGAVLVAAGLVPLIIGFAVFSSPVGRGLRLAAAGAVLLVALAGLSLTFDLGRMLSVPELAQQFLTSGQTADASANYRLDFYKAGLSAIADSPLVGHGWWQKFEAAAPYMPPDVAAQGLGNRAAHLHNDVLNFGAGSGTLGILAYLLLLVAPILGAILSPHDSQRFARLYGASVLTVAFFTAGLTDSMFVYELPKTVFCLTAALILGYCRDAPPWTPATAAPATL